MATSSNIICIRNNSNALQTVHIPGKETTLKPGAIMELDKKYLESRDLAFLLKSKRLSVITDTAMKYHNDYQSSLKKSKCGARSTTPEKKNIAEADDRRGGDVKNRGSKPVIPVSKTDEKSIPDNSELSNSLQQLSSAFK
jgi:hypothetical protein